jgi:hypothetical protein
MLLTPEIVGRLACESKQAVMPASRATTASCVWMNGLVAGKTTWYGEGYVAPCCFLGAICQSRGEHAQGDLCNAVVTHGKASAGLSVFMTGSRLKGRANPIRKDAWRNSAHSTKPPRGDSAERKCSDTARYNVNPGLVDEWPAAAVIPASIVYI